MSLEGSLSPAHSGKPGGEIEGGGAVRGGAGDFPSEVPPEAADSAGAGMPSSPLLASVSVMCGAECRGKVNDTQEACDYDLHSQLPKYFLTSLPLFNSSQGNLLTQFLSELLTSLQENVNSMYYIAPLGLYKYPSCTTEYQLVTFSTSHTFACFSTSQ